MIGICQMPTQASDAAAQMLGGDSEDPSSLFQRLHVNIQRKNRYAVAPHVTALRREGVKAALPRLKLNVRS
jgi:hypothetical protein